jgi:N6-adenosine-specific RNA methylase IME4
VRPRPGRGYFIIAGRHRFEAARKLKWPTIECRVLEGLKAHEAELAEIDENLIRADLSPAETALHVGKRKAIYERIHPETKQGGDRKSSKAKSKSQNENLKPFVTETAKKTGKGRSTVARDVTRANKVKVLADIAGTSLDQGDELDALAKLDANEQRKLAKRAKAGEKVSAKTKVKQVRRAEREQALGTKQLALPTKKYGVILADPEWEFETWSEAGMDRSAANHYPTSSLEGIKNRDVASIAADDCALLLWATGPMLPQAQEVMAAWGFKYASHIIWNKLNHRGTRQKGTGYWFVNGHEILLLGTKGDVPAPAPGTQWPSVVDAPVGEHSEKPEFAYEWAEQFFPNLPKIELNARRARAGWDRWGLEAPPAEECSVCRGTGSISVDDLDANGIPRFLSRTEPPPRASEIEHEAGRRERAS